MTPSKLSHESNTPCTSTTTGASGAPPGCSSMWSAGSIMRGGAYEVCAFPPQLPVDVDLADDGDRARATHDDLHDGDEEHRDGQRPFRERHRREESIDLQRE